VAAAPSRPVPAGQKWSYSIQLEKVVVKDGEIDMMPVADLSPDDPDADDPGARISFLPGRYGEPI
jgi:hypothetical protein